MRDKSPDFQFPAPTAAPAVAAQFGVVPIPAHAHTGADAQQIDYNNLLNKPAPAVSNSYAGQVASDAVSNVLPTGWSASYNGTTKAYTITHNLGTTNYQPVFYVGSFALWGIIQGSLGANSFTVDFENSSGTTFSTAWGFNLIKI